MDLGRLMGLILFIDMFVDDGGDGFTQQGRSVKSWRILVILSSTPVFQGSGPRATSLADELGIPAAEVEDSSQNGPPRDLRKCPCPKQK